ncbi:TPA: recombinase family protein [Clostridioides difficile]|nr:recombinase family protein [Clostridioides difficile]HBE9357028.1 recombinase family protein [Clostridioides difficile]
MIIYGYARCSTDESRQNIDRQVRELKELGATKETIYLEYESGTNSDRVELNRLLEKVKESDVIVATEVSRITRSTKQLCDILELVQDRKLKLILGGFVVDCTKGELDPMTEGMLKMMGVFAEMERNMISQRVKSGMLNAKVKGKQIGRKRIVKEDIPPIFLKHYDKYKINQEDKKRGKKPIDRRGINLKEFMSITQLSKNTIYKYINLQEND